MRILLGIGSALISLLLANFSVSAGKLVINSNTSDPAPRAAWEEVVAQFQQEHPGIQVEFNVYDHEGYKKSLRNWLTSGSPDVVFWYVGHRMRQLVEPGLLADVSNLFTPDLRREFPQAAIELVTVHGRQFGLPYVHYNLGFYYRDDVVRKADLHKFPETWEGLLHACDRLRALNVVPVALGSRDLWPVAAWFDYINLRLNGIAFHRQLMDGRISYTDRRVRAVFNKWRELIDRRCFLETHASLSWQEAQVLIYQGKAAMMLIGSFIIPNFTREARPHMEFAPFPFIQTNVGHFEDAPMNSLHIPARASNRPDAERFLRFVARADVQEKIAKAMKLIPVNQKAQTWDDRLLREGQKLIAEAEQLMQYFDRDTNEELATVAMKGFQEFLVKPERVDQILATIERTRSRIYQ